MITLSRSYRFLPGDHREVCNAWSGGPLGDIAAVPVELSLAVCGTEDAASGFLCDIKRLDAALASAVAVTPFPVHGWFQWLPQIATALSLPLGVLPRRLGLRLSSAISIQRDFLEVPSMYYTEQFEFSAAHRLHLESLSDAENLRLFGKCNNPNGHGHNYVVEVSIRVAADPVNAALEARALAQLVREEVIERYDHRHLNLDVADYLTLNPTVENITRCVWSRLHVRSPLDTALERVRIYETAKTWAEVRREPASG